MMCFELHANIKPDDQPGASMTQPEKLFFTTHYFINQSSVPQTNSKDQMLSHT